MNRIATTACLLAATALAGAAQADTFNDQARVRHVEPQYETVQVPRQECSSQWVTEPQPVATAPSSRNYGGVILGGVAGAVIGNQIGKGHGREAATAAGAVVGAIAGDRIANSGSGSTVVTAPPQQPLQQREVTTCRTVYDAQARVNGYRVTYEYRGRAATVLMRNDPGPTVPVQVSVVPLER